MIDDGMEEGAEPNIVRPAPHLLHVILNTYTDVLRALQVLAEVHEVDEENDVDSALGDDA